MKRKYLLEHKKEKYQVEAELSLLYGIGDRMAVGGEEFIVIDREGAESDL